MKVAMVVPGGVDRSGVERIIPCLVAAVERIARAHELHVFALRQEDAPGRWPLRGATVHNAGRRPVRVRALAMLLAEHRRAPFDVLHGVWASCAAVAGVAGRILRRPALAHLTGGDLAALPEIDYGHLRTRRGRADVRAAAALARRVTVPSAAMRAAAEARGIRAERLTWGVCPAAWPPRPPVARHGEAEARLLFAASLNRVKDPWTVARAAAALRDRGVRFRLDVVGEDTLGGEVQRLASSLGLDGIVRFHGFLPQPALRPWMERADLLLLASRHEGDPLVALEAGMVGVPVVGTRVGHLAEWAPDAAAAVPPADPAALADSVAALLADESRRMRMAEAAHAHALAWTADRTADRILALYDALAHPPASARSR